MRFLLLLLLFLPGMIRSQAAIVGKTSIYLEHDSFAVDTRPGSLVGRLRLQPNETEEIISYEFASFDPGHTNYNHLFELRTEPGGYTYLLTTDKTAYWISKIRTIYPDKTKFALNIRIKATYPNGQSIEQSIPVNILPEMGLELVQKREFVRPSVGTKVATLKLKAGKAKFQLPGIYRINIRKGKCLFNKDGDEIWSLEENFVTTHVDDDKAAEIPRKKGRYNNSSSIMTIDENGALWVERIGRFAGPKLKVFPSGIIDYSGSREYYLALQENGKLWFRVIQTEWGGWSGPPEHMSDLRKHAPGTLGTHGEGKLVPIINSGVKSIESNYNHSLILKNDGSLWGIGKNYFGQLGIKNQRTVLIPRQVIESGVHSVQTGEYYSVFTKENGTVWAMGHTKFARIGNGRLEGTVKPPTKLVVPYIAFPEEGTANGYFKIVGNEVFVSDPLPKEKTTFRILVKAVSESGVSCEKEFTLKLHPGTTRPTEILLSKSEILELSPGGTLVGELTARDADAVEHHHFQLIPNSDGTPNDNAYYEIRESSGTTPALYTKPSTRLNYNQTNAHSLRIRVRDKDGLTYDQSLTLWIRRCDQSTTQFHLSDDTLALETPPGSYVSTLTVTCDQDLLSEVSLVDTAYSPNDNIYFELWEHPETDHSISEKRKIYRLMTRRNLILPPKPQFTLHLTAHEKESDRFIDGVFALKTERIGFKLNRESIPHNIQVGDTVATLHSEQPGTTFYIPGVKSVKTGNNYTIFTTGNGQLWGWGINSYSVLGKGTEFVQAPVLLEPNGVKQISAGEDHILYTKSDGSLWIDGLEPRRTDSSPKPRKYDLAPKKIFSKGVTKVSAGNFDSYFLTEDGSAWGIGENPRNPHIPTGDSNLKPVLIFPKDTKEIVGHHGSLHLIKKDGTVWAKGRNEVGQLGDRTKVNRNQFVKIADEDISRIIRYRTLSFFISESGSGNCFGAFPNEPTNTSNIDKIRRDLIPIVEVDQVVAQYDHTLTLSKSIGVINFLHPSTQKENSLGEYHIFDPNQGITGNSGNSDYHLYIKEDGTLWMHENYKTRVQNSRPREPNINLIQVATPPEQIIPKHTHSHHFEIQGNRLILTKPLPMNNSWPKKEIVDSLKVHIRAMTTDGRFAGKTFLLKVESQSLN